jgi:hypothetical protein
MEPYHNLITKKKQWARAKQVLSRNGASKTAVPGVTASRLAYISRKGGGP